MKADDDNELKGDRAKRTTRLNKIVADQALDIDRLNRVG
jgi:hypothetical protein